VTSVIVPPVPVLPSPDAASSEPVTEQAVRARTVATSVAPAVVRVLRFARERVMCPPQVQEGATTRGRRPSRGTSTTARMAEIPDSLRRC
jgi:hypothetical protein